MGRMSIFIFFPQGNSVKGALVEDKIPAVGSRLVPRDIFCQEIVGGELNQGCGFCFFFGSDRLGK